MMRYLVSALQPVLTEIYYSAENHPARAKKGWGQVGT
jgi:hypothetical protein